MNALNINALQRDVLGVIRRNPGAADDDALLLERFWIEVDKWDESKSLFWNLSRSRRPESITRRRRELYNMGLIEYKKDALAKREEAFKNEREHAMTVPNGNECDV